MLNKNIIITGVYMKNNDLATLKKKKNYLMNKLRNFDDFIRGSITTIKHKCGNKNCKCHLKGEKHSGLYFSVNIKQKTKLIYLGNKNIDDLNVLLENYNKLKQLLDDIVLVNLEIFKISKKQFPLS